MPSKFAAMESAKADLVAFTNSLFINHKTDENASKLSKIYSHTLHSNDFAEQIISLMDAGFETVALNLTHVITFLAIHQDIQARVFDEIKSVGDEISLERLSQLDLLERVIKETLRLAPPLPFLPREVHKDFELEAGKVVEKGTIVLIPNYGVHRLSSIWGSSSSDFNPDNFLPANTSKRPQNSAFQFSHGKRMCIGHRYAMVVMKIFLVKVLSEFKFETDLRGELKFTAKVTLAIDGERNVKVVRR
jgi:cytochrome P450